MRDLMRSKLMNEAGEGDGGGGDDIQAKIDAAIEEATSGLKSKNQELLESLNTTKKNLKNWEGLDPQEVRGMMDRISQDDELRLLSEGKHEEAWAKRLDKVSATHQAQLEQVNSQAEEFKTKAQQLEERVRDLVIDKEVMGRFIAEKGKEAATQDVVLRAKAAFKIEDGTPIARDENGEIIRGANGPITVDEWVSALKQSASHLFQGSQGAGAEGASGTTARADLTAKMEEAATSGNMAVYRKLRSEAAKNS